jgi:hypothetical protein
MASMVNTTIMVDSKKEVLNSFEIVHAAIEDAGDTSIPMQSQLAGIAAELTQPKAEVKQIGNTIFVAHIASGHEAFVRAFNADTAQNFIANMKEFMTFMYDDLGLDIAVVPGMEDPKLVRLLQSAFARPDRSDMGYGVTPAPNPAAIITLGPKRV